MMKCHKLKSCIILILSVLPFTIQANDSESAQTKLLSEYFAGRLNTSVMNIEVELVHMPPIESNLLSSGQIEVQSGRRKFNLGYQTLWMVHKVGNTVKKRYAVTVDVHANIKVPIARRRINRLERLTPDLIAMESQRIGREYQRIVTDKDVIYGKMSTQTIRQGKVIEKNMLRTRPDVLLGDNLQIILMDEGLYLELPGIAKEEGLIGEIIRVQCPSTRKEFKGILENQNEVIVTLR